MGSTQIIGLLGVTFLLVAWLFQNYRTFNAADVEAMDLHFVGLSLVGSTILAYYAFLIGDMPFLVLNTVIAAAITAQLSLVLKHRYTQ